ncbi:DNA-binding transcriptional regulator, GntR family [Pseudonocardia thermophila]|jgi:Transcriptional regulators|uniref:DNA-binding transcriptional regulator, GntR family n=1 Tax=Pseudonocardia thermophila TaxID=1848 RepID=A0A1M6Q7U2_PSETH|nr:GntR family transcriptional regulator [Pseudonocardia thermophila]SHK16354.1 DNA-binding transcriptional regulator, GntR family [Pseudonocardia thermophila]
MPVPAAAASAQRQLLRDSVFHRIRDAIIDGTLEPGERLLDAELGAWLGVSRTPIREALARLEAAGLVETKPGRYTIVSPIDPRTVRDAQAVTAAMHELAVRVAVPALTDADLAAMREANERFAAALAAGDVVAAIAADDAFHGVPVERAGNAAVRAVLDQYTPVLRRVERIRFASLVGRESVAQHARIVEFAAAGDAEGAALEARRNWTTLSVHAEG